MTGLAAAAERAATTVLSGPAGGVTAGMAIAAASGRRDLVTFDMGGTSCDVALVVNGLSGVASRSKIGGGGGGVPPPRLPPPPAPHRAAPPRAAPRPRAAAPGPAPVAR